MEKIEVNIFLFDLNKYKTGIELTIQFSIYKTGIYIDQELVGRQRKYQSVSTPSLYQDDKNWTRIST